MCVDVGVCVGARVGVGVSVGVAVGGAALTVTTMSSTLLKAPSLAVRRSV